MDEKNLYCDRASSKEHAIPGCDTQSETVGTSEKPEKQDVSPKAILLNFFAFVATILPW
jgi:hypothetical protein